MRSVPLGLRAAGQFTTWPARTWCRIYVDVPEMEANYVVPEPRPRYNQPAVRGEEIDASVTRTSWSLMVQSRTLRADIDLHPNAHQSARNVRSWAGRNRTAQRHNGAACMCGEIGNQNVCYAYQDGKAVEFPLQTGINDGKWIEVTRKRVDDRWVPLTGSENIVQGDLQELSSGQAVDVVRQSSQPIAPHAGQPPDRQ